MRYVLGVDFDGVIHRYGQGDQGSAIYDIPTLGAQDALRQYVQAFDVHIVSTRAASNEGRERIKQWLKRYNFPSMPISDRKPPGELLVMLDDRAWRFLGTFPPVAELKAFRPWWSHQ